MNNQTKKPGAMLLAYGDTDPVGDCDKFEAGIHVDAWAQRIVVYGDSPADAEALRNKVMAAMTAQQPPAVGGEPVTIAWAAELNGEIREVQKFEDQVAFDLWERHGIRKVELIDRAHVAPLLAEIERLRHFETAYQEWMDKTDWAKKSAHVSELGKHRADVIADRLNARDALLRETVAILRGGECFGLELDHADVIENFLGQSAPTGPSCGACPGCTDGCRVDRESPPATEDYPECSGTPNDCPENEGQGCGCKAESIGGLVQGVQDQRSEVRS